MTNHVHLVVVPEHENSLARSLGRTHAEYALALNPIREAQRTFVAEPLLFLPTRCIAPRKCHMLCRTESGARRAHRDAVGLAVVERTGAQHGGRKGRGTGLQRHAFGWLGLRRLERESAFWPISRGV